MPWWAYTIVGSIIGVVVGLVFALKKITDSIDDYDYHQRNHRD